MLFQSPIQCLAFYCVKCQLSGWFVFIIDIWQTNYERSIDCRSPCRFWSFRLDSFLVEMSQSTPTSASISAPLDFVFCVFVCILCNFLFGFWFCTRRLLLKCPIYYTMFQKTLTFLFCCIFYKHWPIFLIFGIQYTEVSCNTAVLICPLHLHTDATLPWENLNCIIMTLLTSVKYCSCTNWKISSFPCKFCPTELRYYNNLLFHQHRPNWRS